MKNIKFKYDYLVFLCAYLRNVDLSLDRSWEAWNGKELRNYYRDFIPPIKVANSLQKRASNIDLSDNVETKVISKDFLWIKRAYFYFFPLRTLADDDIKICYTLLLQVQKFLESDIQQYNMELQQLRVDISNYYFDVLRFRLKGKDFSRIIDIEHYFENRETRKISEFLKDMDL